jgi:hypothetical protein
VFYIWYGTGNIIVHIDIFKMITLHNLLEQLWRRWCCCEKIHLGLALIIDWSNILFHCWHRLGTPLQASLAVSLAWQNSAEFREIWAIPYRLWNIRNLKNLGNSVNTTPRTFISRHFVSGCFVWVSGPPPPSIGQSDVVLRSKSDYTSPSPHTRNDLFSYLFKECCFSWEDRHVYGLFLYRPKMYTLKSAICTVHGRKGRLSAGTTA